MTWKTFWNPPGKSYVLFFSKFFIFALIGFFLWVGVRHPYNTALKYVSVGLVLRSLPVIDYRFNNEEGYLSIMCQPYRDGPIKPRKNDPVVYKLYFNRVHYNLIPFFAFILASPLRNWRKMLMFILIGLTVLFASHVFHVYIGSKYNYIKIQDEKGYFSLEKSKVKASKYKEIKKWQWKIGVIENTFGFMEQAGSMLLPAILWMIYASKWILMALQPKELKKINPQE